MIGQIRNKFGNQLRVVGYIGVLAVALIALSVPAGDAFADEPPSDESPSDGTSYTSRGSSGNFFTRWFTANFRLSPSDCVQWPNDPRFSNPDNVNSKIQAACRVQVPEMYHIATLRKKEEGSTKWSVAGSGSFHRKWVKKGAAYANADCENMIYQVDGQGWVIDVDNKIYYASTKGREINNPCNH